MRPHRERPHSREPNPRLRHPHRHCMTEGWRGQLRLSPLRLDRNQMVNGGVVTANPGPVAVMVSTCKAVLSPKYPVTAPAVVDNVNVVVAPPATLTPEFMSKKPLPELDNTIDTPTSLRGSRIDPTTAGLRTHWSWPSSRVPPESRTWT